MCRYAPRITVRCTLWSGVITGLVFYENDAGKTLTVKTNYHDKIENPRFLSLLQLGLKSGHLHQTMTVLH